MNILMICTEKLPVPNIRGGAIQTYIDGVSGMLAQHHQLTILSRTDPDLPDTEQAGGVRYVRVPSDGIFEIYAANVVQYLQSTQEQYDIIHIFNRPRLVLPVRQMRPAARIILSMHNDMFEWNKIDRQEATAALEQTERIITISNYVGQRISTLFPQAQGKVRTIYSGVDLSRYAPWMESEAARQVREQVRQQHQLSSRKVILFVGRLSRNKGPHVLIRAMNHLRHQDASLVIVGGAWYSDDRVSDYIAYLRALAARSPIPVITTGFIPAQEVYQWFNAADVFVCTSIWNEPLARVHYEAMASGLPFITTARGGNPEIVTGENGLLIQNPEDPLEYAQALNELLSDLNRARQMGLNGRRMVEQHFTWQRVAAEILGVWEQTL